MLIGEVAGDEWWQDVTVPMLETARRRLRALIKLIEKANRKTVYTDFEDDLGPETVVEMEPFQAGTNTARFLAKTRQFLKTHENHITIHKLRRNVALTSRDLDELERMMVDAAVGTAEEIAYAKEENHGLGIFIRSLVGLEREAAKEAFGEFLAGGTATASQIEFINLIVDHLTEHGVMKPERLYESPFTDINARGPEGVFPFAQVERLVAVLDDIEQRAAA